MIESGYFNNGHFREYSYYIGRQKIGRSLYASGVATGGTGGKCPPPNPNPTRSQDLSRSDEKITGRGGRRCPVPVGSSVSSVRVLPLTLA